MEAVHQIYTLSAHVARRARAVVNVLFTKGPGKAGKTCARENAIVVFTRSIVSARAA